MMFQSGEAPPDVLDISDCGISEIDVSGQSSNSASTSQDMTPPTRLPERSVLILASLAGGPKHGYALTRDVQDFAGVRLGPGTLYGCLARLEASGLVEALPADDRRHPYRITAIGRDLLRERLAATARVAAIGLARIESG